MKLVSLSDVFLDGLRDLYSAESQLTKALPKMAKAAANEDLRAAFESHLTETQGQVERLDTIFENLDENPKGKKCKAMAGLIEEGAEIIAMSGEDAAKDAALIGAAQKVEHFEIAGYGTARTLATLLGHEDAAGLLQETLDEEASADQKLTQIAQTINAEAQAAA